MSGWLSRATEALRKQVPLEPSSFDVECDCGTRVTGDRKSTVQKPDCPTCGRPVFVLPVSVYPKIKKPQVKRPLTQSSTKGKEQAAAETTKSDLSASTAMESKSAEAPQKASQPPAVTESGVRLDTRDRMVTPFRVTIVVIVLLVGLTGWGLWYRSQIENAKVVVARATQEGMKAMTEGDFETAARELEQARRAVDLLNRFDEEAKSVRRMARESLVARDLSMISLPDRIDDALSRFKQGDEAETAFSGNDAQSWILFDAVLLKPEDKSRSPYLDMPLHHEGQTIRIDVDFPDLVRAMEKTPDEAVQRVIFAAQLERIAPPLRKKGRPVLTLNGQTAFLWTSIDTLITLGHLQLEEEELISTRSVIQRQLKIVEEHR